MFLFSLIHSFTYQAQKSVKGTFEIGKRIYLSMLNQPLQNDLEIPIKPPTTEEEKKNLANKESYLQKGNDLENEQGSIFISRNQEKFQMKLLPKDSLMTGEPIDASLIVKESPSMKAQTFEKLSFFVSSSSIIAKENDLWKISGKIANFTFVPSMEGNYSHIILGPETMKCAPKTVNFQINEDEFHSIQLILDDIQIFALQSAIQIKSFKIDVVENWGDDESTCLSNVKFYSGK